MTVPSMGLAVALALAGCSAKNPLFEVSSGGETASTGAGDPTRVGSTGDALTSTTSRGTDGSESGVGTSQTTTTGEPGTGSSTAAGVDTGSSASAGPDSDTGAAMCGDDVLDMGEQCDDGNQVEEDGCTNMCMLAACGDGLVHLGVEQCDDGNQVADDECSNLCQLTGCGDGVVQQGEQCDQGANNGVNKACLGDCKLNVCGDGDQGPKEACDDNEAKNGLFPGGCSVDCSAIILKDLLKIKVVTAQNGTFNGNLGISGGDKMCANKVGANYKIMATDGDTRIASVGANEGDGQGWVLFPHRAYINDLGHPVFITGPEALLGVRKKVTVPLVNPIGKVPAAVWTGLGKTWQSSPENCGKWTGLQLMGAVGSADLKENAGFISSGVKGCIGVNAIYCVQQPG